MCDMTHSYVSHDSFVFVAFIYRMCNVTHSYTQHDSFKFVKYMRYFHIVKYLINIRVLTRQYEWHDLQCLDSSMRYFHIVKYLICKWGIFIFVKYRIYIRVLTRPYEWHDWFICVTCLIQRVSLTRISSQLPVSDLGDGKSLLSDVTFVMPLNCWVTWQMWRCWSHCWVTSHLSRHKCDVSQQSRHSTVIWVNSVSDFTVEWRQISQLVWRNMGNQENPLIRGFLDFPCFFTRAVRFHCWMTSMLSEQWSESTVPQIW